MSRSISTSQSFENPLKDKKDLAIATTKKRVPNLSVEPFINEENPQSIESCSTNYQNVFIPSWENRPEDVNPVVTLGTTPILTHQNTSMIIALPGMGKSSICESICASYLNPLADCLGFVVDKDCKGVIYIDNERTKNDVWNSFNRTCRRAAIPHGGAFKNVIIAGLRAVPRLDQRLSTIEQLLTDNPCSVLLIDGLGDLVTDSNDLMQAIDCRIWLRETTVRYNVSILTTIHPNPNSSKPRGHIGSEGHRESECVLLAKSGEGDMRILTTDFDHGKNRNNAHVTTGFRWSDEFNMFLTADPDLGSFENSPRNKGARKLKSELVAFKLVPAPKALTHTDLINSIIEYQTCSESSAKRLIKDMIDYKFLKKHEDGLYRSII